MNLFTIESVTGYTMDAGPTGTGTTANPAPRRTAINTIGLAAFQPESGTAPTPLSAGDWNIINDVVQGSLSDLTARIRSQEPRTNWKAGRTKTRAFPLFSYRVFYHLDGDDYDPIVVGLTFTERGAEIRIAGDISGDESGFVYFDEGCTVDSPSEPLAVQHAARIIADRLAARDSIIIEAIRNRHPRAVAR
jgi:hypothetical protein